MHRGRYDRWFIASVRVMFYHPICGKIIIHRTGLTKFDRITGELVTCFFLNTHSIYTTYTDGNVERIESMFSELFLRAHTHDSITFEHTNTYML